MPASPARSRYPKVAHADAVQLDDVARVSGPTCTITLCRTDRSVYQPPAYPAGYRIPLALAGTAAAMLGHDPAPLSLPGVAGRMSIRKQGNILVIDNANSGTT